MFAQDDVTQLVVGRLFDFFDHRTPWQRSLWTVSTPLALKVEGKEKGPDDPGKAARIQHIVVRASIDYLARWGRYLDTAGTATRVEHAARSIAAYLLDEGFSADHLHSWLTAVSADPTATLSLAALCEELAIMARRPAIRYPVLIPFTAIPQVESTPRHIKYLDATETSDWLRAEGVTKPKVRWAGALLVTVEARDPWAAVERAGEIVARLSARVAVGLDSAQLKPSGKVWVSGRDRAFDLEQERRRIRVPSLQRGKDLYAVGSYAEADALNDALELLAAMETSTPGAALSNGWAAVEGLLVLPGEQNNFVAADRMAAIVACSFPRAELTWLAHAQLTGNDQLAEDLRRLNSVTHRVALLEESIRNGAIIRFTNPRDEAALARIRRMIAHPKDTLTQVRSYVESAFRRLYNQRNVVMHGGNFQSVAMRPTLRTVPPLAAAGLDRVVVAERGRPRTSAFALAARAELELELLESDSSRQLHNLLD